MRVLVCSNSLVIVSLVVVSRHNHNVPTVGDTIVCRRQIFGYLSSHKSGVHSTLEPRLQPSILFALTSWQHSSSRVGGDVVQLLALLLSKVHVRGRHVFDVEPGVGVRVVVRVRVRV